MYESSEIKLHATHRYSDTQLNIHREDIRCRTLYHEPEHFSFFSSLSLFSSSSLISLSFSLLSLSCLSLSLSLSFFPSLCLVISLSFLNDNDNDHLFSRLSLCTHSSALPCVPEFVGLGNCLGVPAQTSSHLMKRTCTCAGDGDMLVVCLCVCCGVGCVCVSLCGVVWCGAVVVVVLVLLVCVDCRRCVVCCTLTVTPDVETSFGYIQKSHGYSRRLFALVCISHHVDTRSSE